MAHEETIADPDDPFETGRKHDLAILDSKTELELREWLLSDLDDRAFSPVETLTSLSDTTVAEQIYGLYARASSTTKDKLKRAIVHAVQEWTPDRSVSTLETLIILTAYTHAFDALPCLRIYVDRANEFFPDHTARYNIVDTIIAALRESSAHPKTISYFKRWFYSNVFDTDFALQVFLGLCEAAPELFYNHIERLMWFIKNYHGAQRWQLEHYLDEFDEIVDSSTILSLLPKVPLSVKQDFINLLYFSDFSPYENVDVTLSMSRHLDVTEVAFIHLELKLVDSPPVEYPLSEYREQGFEIFQAFKRKESVARKLENLSAHPVRRLREKMQLKMG